MKQNAKLESKLNLFVPEPQNQMQTDLFDGYSQSFKYGDNCICMAQPVINPISMNICYNSFFNASSEFIITD